MSNSHNLLTIAYEQIDRLPADKTLIILHPANYQYHRQITYRFLNQGNSAYLHINNESATLGAFLQELELTLAEQADIHLDKLSRSAKKAGTQLAEALNQTDSLTLVIDGYDYVNDDAIHDCLLTASHALTPHHRIVICSREMPLGMLPNQQNSQCAMLPSIPEHLLVDYIQKPENINILEVRALGPTQAHINGRALTQWDGVLPKCLFYFLVDRAMTTRNDIFDTFWPKLDKREATNVFHVTKRKVSEILGQDLTTYASGFYRVADDIELHYDVVAFQEAAQNAEVADDPEEAIQLYQEAIRLYRGPFLSTLDQDWIQERREELQIVYTESLTGLARIYEKQGKQNEALGLYLRAAANMPHREDLARTIMNIYADLNQPEYALDVFDRLAHELHTSLNVEPDPETTKLANKIQKRL